MEDPLGDVIMPAVGVMATTERRGGGKWMNEVQILSLFLRRSKIGSVAL